MTGKSKQFNINLYLNQSGNEKIMIVQGSQLPQFSELIQILKTQFSGYSVYTLGSKSQKSIIVQKSSFIGAQITVRDQEINVDACCPNLFVSAIIGFINTIFTPYAKFEMRIANFLKVRYS
ncbi:hypothetical protein [uncultured Marivirga sp.]|uniref:hypothetical protein n=1 Tax=uncultured Marivirga sp. TaxID=1123707 RepID=UPI0030EB96EB|tara:strand:+ start:536581 stop:536943 length:363 start_codon:yes stop_codon:yes gene_type:complete